jgi:hypothetical protein
MVDHWRPVSVIDNRIITLASPLVAHEFGADQYDALYQHVAAEDEGTQPRMITDPADVTFSDVGLLPGGYRMTYMALRQLCQVLAPGLAVFVADVGGLAERASSRKYYQSELRRRSAASACSPQLAIATINDMVRLRFDMPGGLASQQLLRNSRTKQVEAVVSAGYLPAANQQMLDDINEHLGRQPYQAVFNGAVASGRWLMCSWRYDRHVTIGDRDFTVGLAIDRVSLGAGQILGAPTLQLSDDPTVRCRRFVKHNTQREKSASLRIAGLFRKLGPELEAIAATQPNPAIMEPTLGLVATGKLDVKRRRQLRHMLAKRGMSPRIPGQIVTNLIYMGADGDVMPQHISVHDVAARTQFDFALRTMRDARHVPIALRAHLECRAYDLLTK